MGFYLYAHQLGGQRGVCGGEGESGGRKQEEIRVGEAKVMWVCVCVFGWVVNDGS